MSVAEAGNIIAITAYFCLSCLFFWIACIPKTNRSTLWWGLATCCTLLARLSLLTLKPVIPAPFIEAIYGLLISTEKLCLLIGFIRFFQLAKSAALVKTIIVLYCLEVAVILLSKFAFNADTFFAIQFSVINATALIFIAVLIARHSTEISSAVKFLLIFILTAFCIHWLSFPIARHYPVWFQYGLIFGNLINLVIYLSFATLALIAFQKRLLTAEKNALDFAKKANQSNEAKSDFLANMSHEIRTPMNGVLGMLELLSKTTLTSDQKHKVSVALSSGKSLLTLINDILDFSKIEAGKLTVESIPFDLPSTLNAIKTAMEPLARAKSLDFNFSFSTHNNEQVEPTILIGDPGRLRQILTNLIGNAIKFTPSGQVTLDIRLTQTTQHIALLHCRVIDTGIGISKEQSDHLFQAFTQADTSTTRHYGGTGLGLTISQKLCEIMGGHIDFTSQENEGSEFFFSLPFEVPHQQEQPSSHSVNTEAPPTPTLRPTAQPKQLESSSERNSDLNSELNSEVEIENAEKPPALKESPEDQQQNNTHRILLVDDNEINQLVAEGILEDYHYECVMACNGEEAIAQLLKHQNTQVFDLILMDCQMPVMDGYQCTQAIRNGRAGTGYQTTPILAMTANAMKGDREKCLTAGMDDYITKPIDEEVLISTLKRWLGKRSHYEI